MAKRSKGPTGDVIRSGRSRLLCEGLRVMTFHNAVALDQWFERQTLAKRGIWLKLRKKLPGRSFLSRQEAVDAALCHGWIDGKCLTHDERFYLVRLTPRRSRSRWSERNRERAQVLIEGGRVRPQGMAQIEAAKANGLWGQPPPLSAA